jgi:CRISPR-associated protein Cmr6
VQAVAPIAIGLGNASPLEVGIRLHHTYGMPLLPASALKGLCRRVARLLRHDSKLSDEAIDALFGFSRDTQAAAGAVVFYDAWYDPSSVDGAPFHRDVITVHHPAYYGDGKTPPTDFDDPTPVPFLVIKPGAQFLCVLDAPDPAWAALRRADAAVGAGESRASARRPTRATATSSLPRSKRITPKTARWRAV